MNRRLRIRLDLDPRYSRVWHRRLAEDLRAAGHDVSLSLRPSGPRFPGTLSALLALERVVYGSAGDTAGAAWEPPHDAPAEPAGADLVLDLTAQPPDAQASRTLAPLYAGAFREEVAAAELLGGRIPEIGFFDSGNQAAHMFRAAVERPRVLSKALDNLGARLITIFTTAVEDISAVRPLRGQVRPLDRSTHAEIGSIGALAGRARLAIESITSKAPHWFVGWRQASGANRTWETMQVPQCGWTRLPDDGTRFFADPFLFTQGGRTWLFLEEFQYAVGRALISVVEFGADGPLGTPRPIIERPYHLSYPFVFERDGEIWMLPEMSAAKRVELFRAVKFPHEWETVAVLIEGQEISDATLVEHQDRLWLFATVASTSASSWDALHIWSARALRGPWLPHERNPVLIDAGAARPAGAFYRRGPDLWRPAQDCTTSYGAGLALARVTQLDDQNFAQEVRATLSPGATWPGIGLHTLNTSADFEVVDGASPGKS